MRPLLGRRAVEQSGLVDYRPYRVFAVSERPKLRLDLVEGVSALAAAVVEGHPEAERAVVLLRVYLDLHLVHVADVETPLEQLLVGKTEGGVEHIIVALARADIDIALGGVLVGVLGIRAARLVLDELVRLRPVDDILAQVAVVGVARNDVVVEVVVGYRRREVGARLDRAHAGEQSRPGVLIAREMDVARLAGVVVVVDIAVVLAGLGVAKRHTHRAERLVRLGHAVQTRARVCGHGLAVGGHKEVVLARLVLHRNSPSGALVDAEHAVADDLARLVGYDRTDAELTGVVVAPRDRHGGLLAVHLALNDGYRVLAADRQSEHAPEIVGAVALRAHDLNRHGDRIGCVRADLAVARVAPRPDGAVRAESSRKAVAGVQLDYSGEIQTTVGHRAVDVRLRRVVDVGSLGASRARRAGSASAEHALRGEYRVTELVLVVVRVQPASHRARSRRLEILVRGRRLDAIGLFVVVVAEVALSELTLVVETEAPDLTVLVEQQGVTLARRRVDYLGQLGHERRVGVRVVDVRVGLAAAVQAGLKVYRIRRPGGAVLAPVAVQLTGDSAARAVAVDDYRLPCFRGYAADILAGLSVVVVAPYVHRAVLGDEDVVVARHRHLDHARRNACVYRAQRARGVVAACRARGRAVGVVSGRPCAPRPDLAVGVERESLVEVADDLRGGDAGLGGVRRVVSEHFDADETYHVAVLVQRRDIGVAAAIEVAVARTGVGDVPAAACVLIHADDVLVRRDILRYLAALDLSGRILGADEVKAAAVQLDRVLQLYRVAEGRVVEADVAESRRYRLIVRRAERGRRVDAEDVGRADTLADIARFADLKYLLDAALLDDMDVVVHIRGRGRAELTDITAAEGDHVSVRGHNSGVIAAVCHQSDVGQIPILVACRSLAALNEVDRDVRRGAELPISVRADHQQTVVVRAVLLLKVQEKSGAALARRDVADILDNVRVPTVGGVAERINKALRIVRALRRGILLFGKRALLSLLVSAPGKDVACASHLLLSRRGEYLLEHDGSRVGRARGYRRRRGENVELRVRLDVEVARAHLKRRRRALDAVGVGDSELSDGVGAPAEHRAVREQRHAELLARRDLDGVLKPAASLVADNAARRVERVVVVLTELTVAVRAGSPDRAVLAEQQYMLAARRDFGYLRVVFQLGVYYLAVAVEHHLSVLELRIAELELLYGIGLVLVLAVVLEPGVTAGGALPCAVLDGVVVDVVAPARAARPHVILVVVYHAEVLISRDVAAVVRAYQRPAYDLARIVRGGLRHIRLVELDGDRIEHRQILSDLASRRQRNKRVSADVALTELDVLAARVAQGEYPVRLVFLDLVARAVGRRIGVAEVLHRQVVAERVPDKRALRAEQTAGVVVERLASVGVILDRADALDYAVERLTGYLGVHLGSVGGVEEHTHALRAGRISLHVRRDRNGGGLKHELAVLDSLAYVARVVLRAVEARLDVGAVVDYLLVDGVLVASVLRVDELDHRVLDVLLTAGVLYLLKLYLDIAVKRLLRRHALYLVVRVVQVLGADRIRALAGHIHPDAAVLSGLVVVLIRVDVVVLRHRNAVYLDVAEILLHRLERAREHLRARLAEVDLLLGVEVLVLLLVLVVVGVEVEGGTRGQRVPHLTVLVAYHYVGGYVLKLADDVDLAVRVREYRKGVARRYRDDVLERFESTGLLAGSVEHRVHHLDRIGALDVGAVAELSVGVVAPRKDGAVRAESHRVQLARRQLGRGDKAAAHDLDAEQHARAACLVAREYHRRTVLHVRRVGGAEGRVGRGLVSLNEYRLIEHEELHVGGVYRLLRQVVDEVEAEAAQEYYLLKVDVQVVVVLNDSLRDARLVGRERASVEALRLRAVECDVSVRVAVEHQRLVVQLADDYRIVVVVVGEVAQLAALVRAGGEDGAGRADKHAVVVARGEAPDALHVAAVLVYLTVVDLAGRLVLGVERIVLARVCGVGYPSRVRLFVLLLGQLYYRVGRLGGFDRLSAFALAGAIAAGTLAAGTIAALGVRDDRRCGRIAGRRLGVRPVRSVVVGYDGGRVARVAVDRVVRVDRRTVRLVIVAERAGEVCHVGAVRLDAVATVGEQVQLLRARLGVRVDGERESDVVSGACRVHVRAHGGRLYRAARDLRVISVLRVGVLKLTRALDDSGVVDRSLDVRAELSLVVASEAVEHAVEVDGDAVGKSAVHKAGGHADGDRGRLALLLRAGAELTVLVRAPRVQLAAGDYRVGGLAARRDIQRRLHVARIRRRQTLDHTGRVVLRRGAVAALADAELRVRVGAPRVDISGDRKRQSMARTGRYLDYAVGLVVVYCVYRLVGRVLIEEAVLQLAHAEYRLSVDQRDIRAEVVVPADTASEHSVGVRAPSPDASVVVQRHREVLARRDRGEGYRAARAVYHHVLHAAESDLLQPRLGGVVVAHREAALDDHRELHPLRRVDVGIYVRVKAELSEAVVAPCVDLARAAQRYGVRLARHHHRHCRDAVRVGAVVARVDLAQRLAVCVEVSVALVVRVGVGRVYAARTAAGGSAGCIVRAVADVCRDKPAVLALRAVVGHHYRRVGELSGRAHRDGVPLILVGAVVARKHHRREQHIEGGRVGRGNLYLAEVLDLLVLAVGYQVKAGAIAEQHVLQVELDVLVLADGQLRVRHVRIFREVVRLERPGLRRVDIADYPAASVGGHGQELLEQQGLGLTVARLNRYVAVLGESVSKLAVAARAPVPDIAVARDHRAVGVAERQQHTVGEGGVLYRSLALARRHLHRAAGVSAGHVIGDLALLVVIFVCAYAELSVVVRAPHPCVARSGLYLLLVLVYRHRLSGYRSRRVAARRYLDDALKRLRRSLDCHAVLFIDRLGHDQDRRGRAVGGRALRLAQLFVDRLRGTRAVRRKQVDRVLYALAVLRLVAELTVGVVAEGVDVSVRAEHHAVALARRDGDGVRDEALVLRRVGSRAVRARGDAHRHAIGEGVCARIDGYLHRVRAALIGVLGLFEGGAGVGGGLLAHAELSVSVVAPREHRSVRAESHRVAVSRRYVHDVADVETVACAFALQRLHRKGEEHIVVYPRLALGALRVVVRRLIVRHLRVVDAEVSVVRVVVVALDEVGVEREHYRLVAVLGELLGIARLVRGKRRAVRVVVPFHSAEGRAGHPLGILRAVVAEVRLVGAEQLAGSDIERERTDILVVCLHLARLVYRHDAIHIRTVAVDKHVAVLVHAEGVAAADVLDNGVDILADIQLVEAGAVGVDDVAVLHRVAAVHSVLEQRRLHAEAVLGELPLDIASGYVAGVADAELTAVVASEAPDASVLGHEKGEAVARRRLDESVLVCRGTLRGKYLRALKLALPDGELLIAGAGLFGKRSRVYLLVAVVGNRLEIVPVRRVVVGVGALRIRGSGSYVVDARRLVAEAHRRYHLRRVVNVAAALAVSELSELVCAPAVHRAVLRDRHNVVLAGGYRHNALQRVTVAGHDLYRRVGEGEVALGLAHSEATVRVRAPRPDGAVRLERYREAVAERDARYRAVYVVILVERVVLGLADADAQYRRATVVLVVDAHGRASAAHRLEHPPAVVRPARADAALGNYYVGLGGGYLKLRASGEYLKTRLGRYTLEVGCVLVDVGYVVRTVLYQTEVGDIALHRSGNIHRVADHHLYRVAERHRLGRVAVLPDVDAATLVFAASDRLRHRVHAAGGMAQLNALVGVGSSRDRRAVHREHHRHIGKSGRRLGYHPRRGDARAVRRVDEERDEVYVLKRALALVGVAVHLRKVVDYIAAYRHFVNELCLLLARYVEERTAEVLLARVERSVVVILVADERRGGGAVVPRSHRHLDVHCVVDKTRTGEAVRYDKDVSGRCALVGEALERYRLVGGRDKSHNGVAVIIRRSPSREHLSGHRHVVVLHRIRGVHLVGYAEELEVELRLRHADVVLRAEVHLLAVLGHEVDGVLVTRDACGIAVRAEQVILGKHVVVLLLRFAYLGGAQLERVSGVGKRGRPRRVVCRGLDVRIVALRRLVVTYRAYKLIEHHVGTVLGQVALAQRVRINADKSRALAVHRVILIYSGVALLNDRSVLALVQVLRVPVALQLGEERRRRVPRVDLEAYGRAAEHELAVLQREAVGGGAAESVEVGVYLRARNAVAHRHAEVDRIVVERLVDALLTGAGDLDRARLADGQPRAGVVKRSFGRDGVVDAVAVLVLQLINLVEYAVVALRDLREVVHRAVRRVRVDAAAVSLIHDRIIRVGVVGLCVVQTVVGVRIYLVLEDIAVILARVHPSDLLAVGELGHVELDVVKRKTADLRLDLALLAKLLQGEDAHVLEHFLLNRLLRLLVDYDVALVVLLVHKDGVVLYTDSNIIAVELVLGYVVKLPAVRVDVRGQTRALRVDLQLAAGKQQQVLRLRLPLEVAYLDSAIGGVNRSAKRVPSGIVHRHRVARLVEIDLGLCLDALGHGHRRAGRDVVLAAVCEDVRLLRLRVLVVRVGGLGVLRNILFVIFVAADIVHVIVAGGDLVLVRAIDSGSRFNAARRDGVALAVGRAGDVHGGGLGQKRIDSLRRGLLNEDVLARLTDAVGHASHPKRVVLLHLEGHVILQRTADIDESGDRGHVALAEADGGRDAAVDGAQFSELTVVVRAPGVHVAGGGDSVARVSAAAERDDQVGVRRHCDKIPRASPLAVFRPVARGVVVGRVAEHRARVLGQFDIPAVSRLLAELSVRVGAEDIGVRLGDDRRVRLGVATCLGDAQYHRVILARRNSYRVLHLRDLAVFVQHHLGRARNLGDGGLPVVLIRTAVHSRRGRLVVSELTVAVVAEHAHDRAEFLLAGGAVQHYRVVIARRDGGNTLSGDACRIVGANQTRDRVVAFAAVVAVAGTTELTVGVVAPALDSRRLAADFRIFSEREVVIRAGGDLGNSGEQRRRKRVRAGARHNYSRRVGLEIRLVAARNVAESELTAGVVAPSVGVAVRLAENGDRVVGARRDARSSGEVCARVGVEHAVARDDLGRDVSVLVIADAELTAVIQTPSIYGSRRCASQNVVIPHRNFFYQREPEHSVRSVDRNGVGRVRSASVRHRQRVGRSESFVGRDVVAELADAQLTVVVRAPRPDRAVRLQRDREVFARADGRGRELVGVLDLKPELARVDVVILFLALEVGIGQVLGRADGGVAETLVVRSLRIERGQSKAVRVGILILVLGDDAVYLYLLRLLGLRIYVLAERVVEGRSANRIDRAVALAQVESDAVISLDSLLVNNQVLLVGYGERLAHLLFDDVADAVRDLLVGQRDVARELGEASGQLAGRDGRVVLILGGGVDPNLVEHQLAADVQTDKYRIRPVVAGVLRVEVGLVRIGILGEPSARAEQVSDRSGRRARSLAVVLAERHDRSVLAKRHAELRARRRRHYLGHRRRSVGDCGGGHFAGLFVGNGLGGEKVLELVEHSARLVHLLLHLRSVRERSLVRILQLFAESELTRVVVSPRVEVVGVLRGHGVQLTDYRERMVAARRHAHDMALVQTAVLLGLRYREEELHRANLVLRAVVLIEVVLAESELRVAVVAPCPELGHVAIARLDFDRYAVSVYRGGAAGRAAARRTALHKRDAARRYRRDEVGRVIRLNGERAVAVASEEAGYLGGKAAALIFAVRVAALRRVLVYSELTVLVRAPRPNLAANVERDSEGAAGRDSHYLAEVHLGRLGVLRIALTADNVNRTLRAGLTVVGATAAELELSVVAPGVDGAVRRERHREVTARRDGDDVLEVAAVGVHAHRRGDLLRVLVRLVVAGLTARVLAPAPDISVGVERERMCRARGYHHDVRQLGADVVLLGVDLGGHIALIARGGKLTVRVVAPRHDRAVRQQREGVGVAADDLRDGKLHVRIRLVGRGEGVASANLEGHRREVGFEVRRDRYDVDAGAPLRLKRGAEYRLVAGGVDGRDALVKHADGHVARGDVRIASEVLEARIVGGAPVVEHYRLDVVHRVAGYHAHYVVLMLLREGEHRDVREHRHRVAVVVRSAEHHAGGGARLSLGGQTDELVVLVAVALARRDDLSYRLVLDAEGLVKQLKRRVVLLLAKEAEHLRVDVAAVLAAAADHRSGERVDCLLRLGALGIPAVALRILFVLFIVSSQSIVIFIGRAVIILAVRLGVLRAVGAGRGVVRRGAREVVARAVGVYRAVRGGGHAEVRGYRVVRAECRLRVTLQLGRDGHLTVGAVGRRGRSVAVLVVGRGCIIVARRGTRSSARLNRRLDARLGRRRNARFGSSRRILIFNVCQLVLELLDLQTVLFAAIAYRHFRLGRRLGARLGARFGAGFNTRLNRRLDRRRNARLDTRFNTRRGGRCLVVAAEQVEVRRVLRRGRRLIQPLLEVAEVVDAVRLGQTALPQLVEQLLRLGRLIRDRQQRRLGLRARRSVRRSIIRVRRGGRLRGQVALLEVAQVVHALVLGQRALFPHLIEELLNVRRLVGYRHRARLGGLFAVRRAAKQSARLVLRRHRRTRAGPYHVELADYLRRGVLRRVDHRARNYLKVEVVAVIVAVVRRVDYQLARRMELLYRGRAVACALLRSHSVYIY